MTRCLRSLKFSLCYFFALAITNSNSVSPPASRILRSESSRTKLTPRCCTSAATHLVDTPPFRSSVIATVNGAGPARSSCAIASLLSPCESVTGWPYCPSIPFFRSALGGFGPSHTEKITSPKAGPAMVSFSLPLMARVVPVPGT